MFASGGEKNSAFLGLKPFLGSRFETRHQPGGRGCKTGSRLRAPLVIVVTLIPLKLTKIIHAGSHDTELKSGQNLLGVGKRTGTLESSIFKAVSVKVQQQGMYCRRRIFRPRFAFD